MVTDHRRFYSPIQHIFQAKTIVRNSLMNCSFFLSTFFIVYFKYLVCFPVYFYFLYVFWWCLFFSLFYFFFFIYIWIVTFFHTCLTITVLSEILSSMNIVFYLINSQPKTVVNTNPSSNNKFNSFLSPFTIISLSSPVDQKTANKQTTHTDFLLSSIL